MIKLIILKQIQTILVLLFVYRIIYFIYFKSKSKFIHQAKTMRATWLFFLPIFMISIQSCLMADILQMKNFTDVIFTGRVLSTHRWSAEQPYSAFVWVFRIFHGESHLLDHYQVTYLQRPLYVIVENLSTSEENSPLKYYDVKLFGVRIINARFYSSFSPLTITLENMKAIEGKISY